ncbi:MAG: tRNA pseudouridine(55) synthase TruB [Cellulosilyticum sp.]|nr:tRNA pseudouridine(55) synthase TruB [Cellulosilyticum sp.]
MLNGIISIYKKRGFTSHDVVAKSRGILRERRIGHTGTLDPEAEGVLPICIGPATKAVNYLADADKCYEAEVILGATTTTEDATGEVLEVYEVNVTKEQIEEVVASFIGPYIQTPPMYSAIKVNGVRLYELARQGIVVERPSREVTIYSCDIIEWIDEKRFRIRVKCSKGTYIRTLCTDIGRALGCGAHMGYLLRTQVGAFTLENSMTLEVLEAHKEQIEPYIYDLDTLFAHLPKAQIKAEGRKYLANGNPLAMGHLKDAQGFEAGMFIRIYNEQDKFVALYKWNEKRKLLEVEKMFSLS